LKPISGAFMAYLGVDEEAIEPPGGSKPLGDHIDHHQVIVDPAKPLVEGNSIFVSISPQWDTSRAPRGQRAITISTHTRVADWYALADDEQAFEDRKQRYLEKLIDAALIALPGLKHHIRLALPGTPLTFERFTRRVNGMVGGFPQKSLWPLAWRFARSGGVAGGRQRLSGAVHRRVTLAHARRPRNRTTMPPSGEAGGECRSVGGGNRSSRRIELFYIIN
jgi:phytoene dehydrogenase-like protein